MTKIDTNGQSTEERIEKRFKGFIPIPKGILLSLRQKSLNPSQLVLWIIGVSLVDWDDRHSTTYGTFNFPFSAIADYFGLDRSTINKQADKLFELGYWVKRSGDGHIVVLGFEQLSQLRTLTIKHGIISIDDLVEFSRQGDDKSRQGVENGQSVAPKENAQVSQDVVEKNHADPFKLYVSSKGNDLDEDEYLIHSYDITTKEPFTIDIRDFDKWNAERQRSTELDFSPGGDRND